MRAFYLFKPDILNDIEALNYCYSFLNNQGIEIKGEYLINNWIDISKLLYEPSNETDIDKIKLLRKQMLTTIKGYQIAYKDEAIVIIIEVEEELLPLLFNFKKELRKKYVYGEEKMYLLFENELPLDNKLSDINLEKIKCTSILVPKLIDIQGYNLVYFNKIHFPDPTKAAVNRDLRIIEEHGNLEEIKVKRKVLYGR